MNGGRRNNDRSSIGLFTRCSVMTNASPATPHKTNSATIQLVVYPASSPWMTAKDRQDKNAAPKKNPR